jgi:Tfp pilus assembly protein PilN
MMLGAKTSLGIDISDTRISVALVRQVNGQIRLVKAVDGPVPQNAVVDGNIADSAALAKAVKAILAQNKIKRRKAVVSLVAKPILSQILELPEGIPGNLGQFIQSEIKRSPALSGREPVCDFCGVSRSGRKDTGRVFVVATDQEKIASMLRTTGLASVEPLSIEPAILASIRALYAKKIAGKYNSNIVFAFFHGPVLTVCVFRKEELDFIRRIDLTAEMDDPDKCIARCKDEINAVVQFYEVEVASDADGDWEFIVALNQSAVDADTLDLALQRELGQNVHVCSETTIQADTGITVNESITKVSIVALGLAMSPFDVPPQNIKIDLLPIEAEEVKSTKKVALITANVAAVILLGMCLTAGFVRFQLKKTQKVLEERKHSDAVNNVEKLLKKQREVNMQIAELTEKRDGMSEVFNDIDIDNWPEILDEIRKKTPLDLYVTKLACLDSTTFLIEGNALSFNSIRVFAGLLNQSPTIQSATVTERKKNNREQGFITYSIKCSLLHNRELQANAD